MTTDLLTNYKLEETFRNRNPNQPSDDMYEVLKLDYIKQLSAGNIHQNSTNIFRRFNARFEIVPDESTSVYVAKIGDDLVGSLSYSTSGQLGLPIAREFNDLYIDEIGRSGDSGLPSCSWREIIEMHQQMKGLAILGGLWDLTIQELKREQEDSNGQRTHFIATHPRHTRWYAKYLGFQTVSEPRNIEYLTGPRPEVLLSASINDIITTWNQRHQD